MALRISSDLSSATPSPLTDLEIPSTESSVPDLSPSITPEVPAAAVSTAAKTDRVGKRIRKPPNRDSIPTFSQRPRSKRQKARLVGVNKEANDLFDECKYAEALQAYETTLSKHPHNQEAFFKKALCQWNLRQVQESKECFRHYLMKYPDDAQAWARKGALLLYQHQYPQALADLRKSAMLQSDGLLEFHLLGPCYQIFRDEVISTYHHLWHLNPPVTAQDLHLLRGIFFASRGEYSSALTEMKIACQNSQDNFALRISQTIEESSQYPRETKNATYQPLIQLPIAQLVHEQNIDPTG